MTIQLSGLFGGAVFGRVRERVARGLVVDVTGVLLLVTGSERRDHAAVFDVASWEPWKVPTPRVRRPRSQAPQVEVA